MRRLKTKLEKSLPKLVHPSWCYESCSGHGRCWQLPKRQEFCECEPGFSGLFCDNEITFNYWWFWLSIGISLSILLLLPVLWCYGQLFPNVHSHHIVFRE
ncbi:unnamed protein product, partial [Mesorhabditis belari]|uniref:EGF-like domain-containing protein n=1 Tax=Mesorhabditis belari TaxID=2138241 RepID=A0AAF3FLF0_9BILA